MFPWMENKRSPDPREPGPEEVVGVIRDIGHGRIEDLGVTRGIPHITPRSKLFLRYRQDHADPPPVPPRDYTSRKPHPQNVKFLEHCRGMNSGVIERVEVADGLPVHWTQP